MAFPSISTPYRVSDRLIKPILVAETESGVTLTRALGSASKREFKLTWPVMTSANKATLETYYNTNAGGSDTWTHPDTATSYTVAFVEDSLSFESVGGKYWTCTLRLKQV